MAMKVSTFNDCKVYNLSSGKTMPQWLSDSKKRALLKDEEYRKRLELIQDFEMTVASQCIKMTKDGEHIIVTGTYPPVVRCYTVSDLALKFQRGLTCEVVAFETLSDDFGKLCFLQADRTLNFHAPYGTHYSVRVPKFGRDLIYNWNNCDMYVCGTGDEIYRLNLEHGQFKEPFQLSYTGCNKMHINPSHNLLGCGGSNGICEFWDPRTRKSVAKLYVDPTTSNIDITALKFDTDGLTLGIGTSHGMCHLYDIRSTNPLYTKEHQYGLPVIDVTFHNTSKHIISTDKKIVKIWERNDPNRGKIMTNIEPTANIHAIHIVEDKKGQSGLMMMAGEQTRVMTYFVPNLGHAPRWCSFLDSLTEELEETNNTNVYEDYKFITKQEVDELGATSLIGTPLLRGYMHGFFMEMKLYNKLRAVSKPFEYEEYRLQKIRDKIEEKRQSRITTRKRLPKVNKELAQKLLYKQDSNTSSASKNNDSNNINNSGSSKDNNMSGGGGGGLVDDRFAALFKREEFQQDITSDEYRLRKPTQGKQGDKRRQQQEDDDDDEYNLVDRDDDDDDDKGYKNNNNNKAYGNTDDEDVDEDDDYSGDDNDNDRGEMNYNDYDEDDDDDEEEYESSNRKRKQMRKKRHNTNSSHDDEDGQIARATKRRLAHQQSTHTTTTQKKAPKMFELSSGISSSKAIFQHHLKPSYMKNGNATSSGQNTKSMKDIPMINRLQADNKSLSSSSSSSYPMKQKQNNTMKYTNYKGSSTIKTLRTEKEGVMKEISFIPKSDTNTDRKPMNAKKVNQMMTSQQNKKSSRLDRERMHFIDH